MVTNARCTQIHWPILRSDPLLETYLPANPAVTARRARNLRDHLVRSHYQGTTNPSEMFGSKGNKWGCTPCGKCIPNVERATKFCDSEKKKIYKITQSNTWTTKAVIYYATYPCGNIYVGLTNRAFKICVREHVRNIITASNEA